MDKKYNIDNMPVLILPYKYYQCCNCMHKRATRGHVGLLKGVNLTTESFNWPERISGLMLKDWFSIDSSSAKSLTESRSLDIS